MEKTRIYQALGKRLRRRCGGTLVETALALSLLLMLAFGAAEFGYFFYIKNILAGAARSGARAAVPSAATNADVTAAVAASMTAAHFTSSFYSIGISPSDVSANAVTAGTPISITVSASWGVIGVTPLSTSMGGLASSRQVTASATMQRED